MRARIVHLATPRRIVATECCAVAFGAGIALLLLGPTPVALGLIAICMFTTMPALLAIDHLERRRAGD